MTIVTAMMTMMTMMTMMPPGGLILLVISPVALVLRGHRLRIFAGAVLLALGAYHWAVPAGGPVKLAFAGFELIPWRPNDPAGLIGLMFCLFGACAFLHLGPRRQDRLYTFAALVHISAALCLLFVGDLLSLFVMWETLTLAAVLLIFRETGDGELPLRYFMFHMVGAVCLLIGIGLHYGAAGSIELGGSLAAGRVFFLAAVCVKAAVIPFHFWLVQVYPRLSPETALLLSGYATKVGVFAISLLLPGLNLELPGALLALVAVLYALKQQDMRLLLAYHMVSQVGFMIAGFGSPSSLARAGGLYYMAGYIFYKGLLFAVVGALSRTFGTRDMTELRGAGRRRPLVMLVAFVASASISGLPPFNGYVSKTLLKLGMVSSVASAILIAAGVGTAFSFAKFLHYAFLRGGTAALGTEQRKTRPPHLPPLPAVQAAAMLVLAAVCLGMGIWPRLLTGHFLGVTEGVYGLKSLWNGTWPIAAAVALLAAMRGPIVNLVGRLTPERLGIWPRAVRAAGGALAVVQRLHSGSLRRYLFWLLGGLVVIWLYLLAF